MQVSISSITIPRAPPGICTKNLLPPYGFCILAFARGGGRAYVGVAPEGQAFVHTRFLPFLEFSELATDSTLGFICCSEILYVLKQIIQPYIEPKLKNENDFSDQILRMRNSLIVRHLILEVHSGKSVCINNHIKEIFIVQLTTDEYFITMKTKTIKG